MPVTLPAAHSLEAHRITRVAAITRQRKTPALAAFVTLRGPLFQLPASALLHWFASCRRGPAQPLAFAGAPLLAVIPYRTPPRCPRHLRRADLRRDTSAHCAVRPGKARTWQC